MNKAIEVAARFLASPTGQKISAEADADALAKRKRLVGEIAQLEAAAVKILPGLVSKEDGALERVAACRASLKVAEDSLHAARHETTVARNHFDRERGVRENTLRASAAPALADFESEISSLAGTIRRSGLQIQGGKKDQITGEIKGAHTNADAVTGTLDLINRTREEIEGMKLMALTNGEIEKRIARSRAEIAKEWNDGRGR